MSSNTSRCDPRRPFRSMIGIYLIALALVLPGCGKNFTLTPVFKGFFVHLATKAGKWIEEKAETLDIALSRAWTAFWNDEQNEVIATDELHGVYDGTLLHRVSWGTNSSQSSVEIKLERPKMVRSAPDKPWELDAEEKKRLESAIGGASKE